MGVYFLIRKNFLGGVHEQYIHACLTLYLMLEMSPAFTDASFQKIAFYCSLEKFLWYGNKYAALVFAIVRQVPEADRSGIAKPASGKKSFYAFLAA